MKFKKNISPIERRRYIRLDHIFPVEFQWLDKNHNLLSKWYQAFSQDVSEGGLCLTVNHLSGDDLLFFQDKTMLMSLVVHIPLGSKGVRVVGSAAWFLKLKDEPCGQYAIGVTYQEIAVRDSKRILRYAATRRMLKTLAFTFSFVLSLSLATIGFYNSRLHMENGRLLKSLEANWSRQEVLSKNKDRLKLQIDELNFLLSQSDRKTEILEKQLQAVKADDRQTIVHLTQAMVFLKEKKERIKTDLSKLMVQEEFVNSDVETKRKEASLLENKILEKLYRWLVVHQNKLTGLVSSYEGDSAIEDWAFTYDQALAGIVFVYAGDLTNARAIFDFYLKAPKMDDGGVANAYYASSGDVAEYIAHAGPNIWLGLALLHYTERTKDMRYLDFIKDIALWLQSLRDNEGGLRGGKTISWYSTEHNLDAYAFYGMLSALTKEETYQKESQEILAWLNKNAFSRLHAPAVKRGKGDATIATDTYAWSVTALGPVLLKRIGMDPDAIIDFAIVQCGVNVEYKRPDGSSVSIKGFDFAKHEHLARGSVISCEWTAQMILAFKIMQEYYRSQGEGEKSQYYGQLTKSYISDLSKMIITSPSPMGQGEFCLPYASDELADTGHGWRTPQGNRTGSVSATTYAILSIKGINPLKNNEP